MGKVAKIYKPRWGVTLTIIVLLIAAAGYSIYPVISTKYNNWVRSNTAIDYNNYAHSVPKNVMQKYIDEAKTYNASLSGTPILDPYSNKRSGEVGYSEYLNTMGGSKHPIARLTVPSVHIDLPVYHGTSDQTITSGVGHLYGTSLPVGGLGEHSVLTSHRGIPNATLFDNLPKVKEGSLAYVTIGSSVLTYRLVSTEVVKPNEIESLKKVDGKDLLTLMTCTPYAVNTHRFLAHFERIPNDPTEEYVNSAKEVKDWAIWGVEDWMWKHIIVTGLLIIAIVALLVREILITKKFTKWRKKQKIAENSENL